MRLLCQLVVGNVAAQKDGKDLQPDTSRLHGLKLQSSYLEHIGIWQATAVQDMGLQVDGRHTMRKEKVVILRRPQGLKSTDSAAK